MPIPQLTNSLDNFLKAVKPLLDENEYEKTKSIINEFSKKDGQGEKLQNLLEERAKKTDNWAS